MAEPKTGTLMTREEIERWERAITVAQRYGLDTALANRFRQYKFVSETRTARVEAATRLLAAERQCMEVYEEHQLAYARLRSLRDKARRHEEIERLQEENLILTLRNDQNRLRDEARETGGATGWDARDELERVKQKTRLDAAKMAAQAEARVEARRSVLRQRDELKAQVLREAGGAMTPEVARELQNIDDIYQAMLDGGNF